jgi:hypothetical protein
MAQYRDWSQHFAAHYDIARHPEGHYVLVSDLFDPRDLLVYRVWYVGACMHSYLLPSQYTRGLRQKMPVESRQGGHISSGPRDIRSVIFQSQT